MQFSRLLLVLIQLTIEYSSLFADRIEYILDGRLLAPRLILATVWIEINMAARLIHAKPARNDARNVRVYDIYEFRIGGIKPNDRVSVLEVWLGWVET